MELPQCHGRALRRRASGNRTTPLVVSIVAASGVAIPKTSSRAITSPAGTADTMEVLAPVDLDLAEMRRVVESEGGCVVWGGAVDLAIAMDPPVNAGEPLFEIHAETPGELAYALHYLDGQSDIVDIGDGP